MTKQVGQGKVISRRSPQPDSVSKGQEVVSIERAVPEKELYRDVGI